MADGKAFDHVCAELETNTSLDRLEARGTVRLALKSAGRDPATTTAAQMQVVVEKVLPKELSSRGIDAVAAVCDAIAASLGAVQDDTGGDSPEEVFKRLGR